MDEKLQIIENLISNILSYTDLAEEQAEKYYNDKEYCGAIGVYKAYTILINNDAEYVNKLLKEIEKDGI